MFRYLPIALAAVIAAMLVAVVPATGRNMIIAQQGIAPAVYTKTDNLAIDGYDAVAYFTDDAPVLGSAEHTATYNNATWHFASAEHKAMFMAEPEKYAPQFGGYCAWATSQGYIAPANPNNWRIVDGELFLNFNDRAQGLWEGDVEGNIAKGDANWPRVLTKNQNAQ